MTPLERLGRWCAAHGWPVVLVWVQVLLLVVGLAVAVGSSTSDDFTVPGSGSKQALDLLAERFPARAGVEGLLVLHVDDGDLRAPGPRAAIVDVAERLDDAPDVTSVALPEDQRAGGRISADGRTAVIAFALDKAPGDVDPDDVQRVLEAAAAAREAGIRTEVGGAVAVAASTPETGAAEVVGLTAAALILLIAFGSAVAMSLPLVTALVGLGIGLAALSALGPAFGIPSVAPSLATMIGLGVGIDYALFVVTRYRTQLAAGMPVLDAAARATATSGAAVVFAGVTVMIAICGLAIAGVPILAAVGYATSLVVALAVLAAITLLPALLGLVGTRIDRLRLPWAGRSTGAGWQRWSQRVGRHPWVSVVLSLTIMLGLAAPALSLRLGQPDSGSASTSTTERRAYDLLAAGFGPGTNGPLLLAVDLASPARPGPEPADGEAAAASTDPRGSDPRLARLTDAVAALPGVASVAAPLVGPDGRAAIVVVIPTTSPQDPGTEALIHRLREDVLPTVTAPGDEVHVGGQTAIFVDLADRVAQRLPWFIGAVVLLSCVLLAVVFRSLLVPLQAAVMNVLSIGAALGVVVGVFQKGVGLDLVGLEEPVPIISFVPLMMFAILFGLSMDYQVFLLSAVREAWLDSDDNREAVTTGLARTGRVITSAALIMMAVFSSFVLSDDPLLKIFGLGLTIAILLDATVVRCMLVPAVMVLCGRTNWWLPPTLDRRLPTFDLEKGRAATDEAAAGATPPPGPRGQGGFRRGQRKDVGKEAVGDEEGVAVGRSDGGG